MTFADFLRANGLQPGTVASDGRWRRCPTETHPHRKNGSYKLASDGRRGWACNHALEGRTITWTPDREEAPAPFDPAALRRATQEAERRAVEATKAAAAFYDRCKPLRGEHPYLVAHGLDANGCFGLRVDRDGWLVVPALRNFKITSVQRISPTGDKRFWPGAPLKGGSYTIERQYPSLTVVCEGLATGLAIFAATPLAAVVVAFDAGNLSRVSIPASGMLTIAADNDWKTQERIGTNPGVEAAQKAATAFGGGVAVPEGMQKSDWCDWRMEKTAERVAKKLPRQTASQIQRDVDAEIAETMLRAARFRSEA